MSKKTIRAVDMVREIRDAQARRLEGLSDKDIIEFFRSAGAAARQKAAPVSQTRRESQQRPLSGRRGE